MMSQHLILLFLMLGFILNKITNEKLKDIVKLEQKKYREQDQKYLIFGKHIVEEALLNNELETLLITKSEFEKFDNSNLIEIFEISEKQLSKFKSLKNIPGVIGVCNINEERPLRGSLMLGLNKINNPSNLGAIIRSAKAFGINDIVLDVGTVDLYNPKTIQAMQGVHFSLNILNNNLYDFCKRNVENYGLITTYLDEHKDLQFEKSLQKFQKNIIILIGNEAQGLDPKFKELPHCNFKINIAYESLNVVVATSIVMYELTKGLYD